MNVELRRASKEHCELLFRWVNDALVRSNAFNTRFISYTQHETWFYNKLNANNSYIYIAYINDVVPIGQIRIDVNGTIGLIDYSIDKEYRGQGFGEELLILIKSKIKEDSVKVLKLVGQVKYDNIASLKTFKKAGYKYCKKHSHIEYFYDISS